ncbi:MAG TPA: hypothetical protein VHK06_03700 [Candidatus Limnocylindria bacterium]|nr:hypothetical protein [Candidatus Limnocylindria bacterium]
MNRFTSWLTARSVIAVSLAALLAIGAAGVALGGPDEDRSVRREDDMTWEAAVRDDDDGDATEGNDGTAGGANTDDGDATEGNDGTAGGANTVIDTGDEISNDGTIGGATTYLGDGDATDGDDGTAGGANTAVGGSASASGD